MEKITPRRLFIAILLPDSVKKNLGKIIGRLSQNYPELHFEKEEKLHLTLKFLGWTNLPQEKIDSLVEEIALTSPPFTLEFSSLNCFFSFNFILFADLKESKMLFNLASKIEKGLEKLGFEKEKRKFKGHLTLARGKRKPVSFWRKYCQEISKEKIQPRLNQGQSFKVSEIVLMESVLGREGSNYTVLSKYPLAKT